MGITEQRYKEKIVDTFKAFDSFCREHDIKYFVAYGTLIGAVRHHGLIPWDDDIDVWMLPDDYEKFKTYKGKISGHYDVIDDRDKGYWLLSLVKFVDTNTTLWEFEHFPFITGVYIDVFPLDECNKDVAVKLRKEYDAKSLQLTYAMMDRSWNHYSSLIKGCKIKMLLSTIKDDIYYHLKYNKIVKDYTACVERIKKSRGTMYVAFDGLYQEREIYRKEWLDDAILLPFEGMEVPAPKGYHEILTQLYGDYMKLPPEEKRVSHHAHFFLDLERRWTISEIRELKKHQ
jgi:lipopolysaccharide cholinephosphotransferase